MSVYLDKSENVLRGQSRWAMKTCHMIADSVDELFLMAQICGMDPRWFQPWSHPHFDLSKTRQKVALEHGAVRLERAAFVGKIRAYRKRLFDDPIEREKLWDMTKKYGGKE